MTDNDIQDQDYEYQKEKYRAFVEQSNIVEQANLESSKLLDKSLLTLSSSFLAITVTLITKMYGYINLNILYFIIGLFIISILCTLISLYTSSKAGFRKLMILRDNYINNIHTNCVEGSIQYNKMTKVLNIIAITSFIVGIILIGLLIYLAQGGSNNVQRC